MMCAAHAFFPVTKMGPPRAKSSKWKSNLSSGFAIPAYFLGVEVALKGAPLEIEIIYFVYIS
jgi:hypothetical protein